MCLRIGVTGGIGSGKSALTALLETWGVGVVDADQAARQVVEPGCPALAEIAARFGNGVIQTDGTLDRPALRALVFSDEAARCDLEAITHPRIRNTLQRQLAEVTSSYVILSSPLLIESGQVAMVDKVIVVDVPESVQVARTMTRDGNDEALVRNILAAQLPRDERLAHADWVIDNSGDLSELQTQVAKLHEELLALAQAVNN